MSDSKYFSEKEDILIKKLRAALFDTLQETRGGHGKNPYGNFSFYNREIISKSIWIMILLIVLSIVYVKQISIYSFIILSLIFLVLILIDHSKSRKGMMDYIASIKKENPKLFQKIKWEVLHDEDKLSDGSELKKAGIIFVFMGIAAYFINKSFDYPSENTLVIGFIIAGLLVFLLGFKARRDFNKEKQKNKS